MTKRALVVVFGDVTHSPRMMNHAKSFEGSGYDVDVIGYVQDPKKLDQEYSKISFFPVPKGFPDLSFNFPPLKMLWMLLIIMIKTIYFAIIGLFRIQRPDVIIVQNPPSLPALLICPLLAWYHKSKYIIDWHNFGYTILALKLGHDHFLVRNLKILEFYVGKFGHIHLTVTKAMKEWLEEHQGFSPESVHILYDRPNHNFHHLSLEDKHEFLTKFFQNLDDEAWGDESPHTKEDPRTGQIVMKANNERQHALVVSSTSWTEDEDFGVLWRAILDCEKRLAKGGPKKASLFPTILLVITGKGPKRLYYEDLFKSQPLYFFKIKTIWLSSEDYPKLLACADLGISLHKSSSALDLPMKIVDMMGCGLPVVSYKYDCIGELVSDEENGFLFEDEEHLAELICELFHGFPKSSKAIREVSEHLKLYPLASWKGHWTSIMIPLLP